MAKDCEFVYLDANGNKSSDYYGVVGDVGHDAAEKNYINKTLEIASTKFSKHTSLNELLAQDEMVKNDPNFDRGKYVSATNILKKHSTPLPEAIVKWKAHELKAMEILRQYNKQNNSSRIDFRKALEKAQTHFGWDKEAGFTENLDELENLAAEIREKWSSQAIEGSLVHEVLQYAVEERNKRMEAHKDAKDGDDLSDSMYDFSLAQVNNMTKIALDKLAQQPGKANLSKFMAGDINQVVKTLFKRIDELEEIHDTTFTALPELNIVGKGVQFEGKAVYGIADLVLYSEKDNKAIIIDFKTKSTSSVHNFDTINASRMTNAFDHLFDNSKTKADLQTSIYAKVLKDDYGIDIPSVDGTEVFVITGAVGIDEGENGSREWKFTSLDPENTKFVKTKSYEGLLSTALTSTNVEGTSKQNLEADISTLFKNKMVSTDDLKKFMTVQEASIKKNDKGQFFWRDDYNKHTYYRVTRDELKKDIEKVHKEYIQKKKTASADLVTLFLSKTGEAPKNSLWHQAAYSNKARFILAGFNNNTHDVFTKDELPELIGAGDDVIVFQDKKSKEISLISLSNLYNSTYEFHEEGATDAKTTMLGPVLSDDAVIAKYGHDIIPPADTHGISLFKLSLVAAELKRKVPGMDKVKSLQSVTVLGDAHNFKTSSVGEQLALIKAMKDELEFSGKDVPPIIDQVLGNDKTADAENYQEDHYANFVKLVRDQLDPLRGLGLGQDAVKASKKLNLLLLQQDTAKNDLTFDYRIEKALAEYVRQMYFVSASKNKATLDNKKAIVLDADFIRANNAYLAFTDMLVLTKPKFTGKFLPGFNSAKTINDPVADKFTQIIDVHEQRAREEMTDFVAEHQRLVDQLIKETEGVGTIMDVLKFDTYETVFTPMLLDGYKFDSDNTDNWMRFKDPETASGLTEFQKEYIRFFNKNVKAGSKSMYNSTTYNHMYPDEGVERTSWRDGDLPILASSATADLQMTMDLDQAQNPLKVVGKLFKSALKPKESGKSDKIKPPWHLDTMMMDQVDTNPGRGSAQTRSLLGVSEDGHAIPKSRNIEKNPILLLNLYMLNASRKKHMQEASFAYHSLDASLLSAQQTFKDAGVDVEPLREVLDNLNKILIQGRFREEGAIGNALDVAGKVTSLGMFFGSWRQFMTETSTVAGQTASASVGNVFNSMLFNGDTKYDAKDYGWASTQIMGAFGNQLMVDYGLYNSDLGQFTSSDYIGTKSKSAFQTKWGFAPIHNVLRQATQTVVLAQMHKDGITDKCFTIDKKTLRYKYDESKDPRFYVFDPDLKIDGQKAEAPTSPEDISKHLLWKAHRAEMLKEGSLKEGKMTRPLTIKNLQSMKNYAVRLYGAMDSKQMMAIEYTAMGRSVSKFKRWMRQKMDNVYSETYLSEKEGKWTAIVDDKGNPVKWEFQADEFEGYVQSVTGLIKEIKRQGGSWAGVNAAMSTRRKENLSKILADLLMYAIMWFSVQALMKTDFYKNSTLGKDAIKGMANAVGDIMPAVGLAGVITGSPMAAVGVISNFGNNMFRSMAHAVSGDFDSAATSANKTMESFGSYRLSEGLVELVTD